MHPIDRLRHSSPRVLVLVGLFLALCHCGDRLSQPNIVLITLDTTRADHLGCYGYFRETSPALDSFAAESILFERCVVSMAMTLPTHVSILTSTYPLEHGIQSNLALGGRKVRFTDRFRSFAEVCREAGYETAAFVSATPVKKETGIGAGFDHFDQPETARRRADETTDRALLWLGERTDRPFFLWVHYFDPHRPLDPPAPFDEMFVTDAPLEEFIRERRISAVTERPLRGGKMDDTRQSINAYDGEIRFMDEQFGRLLEAVFEKAGAGRTAVLVLGDHGEGLGQHGESAHGGTWDEQLRVPMMIRAPGGRPSRVSRLLTAADALPTLLGQIDAPALTPYLVNVTGRDALSSDYEELPVLSQDTGEKKEMVDYRTSLTAGRWKYIRYMNREEGTGDLLFDLDLDPFELSNLCAAQAETASEMRDRIDRRIDDLRRRGEILQEGMEEAGLMLDSTLAEELRALGYLSE
jgi:arylsulfatase A-like enzyme